MVERLKQQVQQLKEELTMATGEQRTDELSQEEKDKSVCHMLWGSCDAHVTCCGDHVMPMSHAVGIM